MKKLSNIFHMNERERLIYHTLPMFVGFFIANTINLIWELIYEYR